MRNIKYELSPSLLSANFNNLKADLDEIVKAGCRYIHLDVMDGMYVPNISFGIPVIKSLRKYNDLIFDTHLMVEEPIRYVKDFADAGVDILTVHVEACKHLDRTIEAIKEHGMKVGVTLNPSTSLSTIEYILEKIDMVLIMSVNPGYGNQKYIEYCTDKIRKLRDMIDSRGLEVDIEVDGGVKLDNLKKVLDAGANIVVAGSAVFGENTYENAKKFNEVLLGYNK